MQVTIKNRSLWVEGREPDIFFFKAARLSTLRKLRSQQVRKNSAHHSWAAWTFFEAPSAMYEERTWVALLMRQNK